jgi:hypothetical protein
MSKKWKNKTVNQRHNHSAASPPAPAIATPLPAPLPASTSPVIQPAPESPDASAKLDFGWHVHGYTNEYVRFADTKAAAVLAISAGLIGGLFAAKAHRFFMDANLVWHGAELRESLLCGGAVASFALLTAAILMAVWAIRPRLWNRQVPGYIFWESVLAHGSPEKYRTSLLQASQPVLAAHVAEHVHALAKICHHKYLWANLSIWAAVAGGVIGGILALFCP